MHICVLGAIAVDGPAESALHIPAATQQLIALLVAAGSDGISKDEIAQQMWPEQLPASWKSSLRNRVTQLRKVLGPDGVVNRSARYQLGPTVTVDSWQLLAAPTDSDDGPNRSGAPLGFLEGEPFAGIPLTPLLTTHVRQVEAARSARIQHLVGTTNAPLAPFLLQALRLYQQQHSRDSATTQQTVIAHFRAGDSARATEIIELTRSAARSDHAVAPWIDRLEDLNPAARQRRRESDRAQPAHRAKSTVDDVEAADNALRSSLFASAAENNDWSMALEVGLSGLPEAAKIHGDPERLKLLEAIPVESLDPTQQFTLASTMAQHLMLVQREDEARSWSLRARAFVQTPDDELTAYLTGAVVGDATNEREPLHLPEAFGDSSDVSISMRSLQVAVVSHLERSPAAEAADMVTRIVELIEASGDPYRRWHTLLLKSMLKFVAGDWPGAAAAAEHAHSYGELFAVADATAALLGQQLNPAWVHPDFGPREIERPAGTSPIDNAMYAALADDGDADEFIDSFNCESRAYFTVPVLALVSHKLTSPVNKRRVANRLSARSGTSVILGSGVMHFGPVDRTLASLTTDDDAIDHHLAGAISVADLQQTRVWQIVCRMDRFVLTRDVSLREDANELATTPALRRLLALGGG